MSVKRQTARRLKRLEEYADRGLLSKLYVQFKRKADVRQEKRIARRLFLAKMKQASDVKKALEIQNER